jgi:hypothetical protein
VGSVPHSGRFYNTEEAWVSNGDEEEIECDVFLCMSVW